MYSCPVLYVCGNHEFYGGHIDRTLEAMKTTGLHVHMLESESWICNQTRFLGTTCWTGFTSTGDASAATRIAAEWRNDLPAHTPAIIHRFNSRHIQWRSWYMGENRYLLNETVQPFHQVH